MYCVLPGIDEELQACCDRCRRLLEGVTKTGKPKKIFVCRVPGCDKCFKRSEHLKRHVRSIHTDDKPWTCKVAACGKTFARGDNLQQHVKNVHPGEDSDNLEQDDNQDNVEDMNNSHLDDHYPESN